MSLYYSKFFKFLFSIEIKYIFFLFSRIFFLKILIIIISDNPLSFFLLQKLFLKIYSCILQSPIFSNFAKIYFYFFNIDDNR